MNRLLILSKVQFKQLMISMFNLKNGKKSSNLLAFVFPAAISLYISGVYTIALAMEALTVEEYYILPLLGIALTLAFVTMFSFYLVNGHLFKNKDYELLSSLPFSKQEIFSVKLVSLYMYQLVYAVFMMLIPCGVYLYSSFNIVRLLMIIITTLLLPIFPMILSTIIGMIVGYISTFFKNTTTITIVLYVALIVGIIIVTNSFTPTLEILSVDIIVNFLKDNISYLYYVIMSFKEVDFLYFGLSLVYSVLPMVVFIYIFAHFFDYINKALRRTKRSKAKAIDESSIVVTNAKNALFKRELKHYLNSPMYVLNTAIGPIMLIIGAVSFLFMDGQTLLMIKMYEEFQLIIVLSIAMMLSIMTTTSVSISLEGKALYILKALPISIKDIFDAKIKLNMLMEYGLSLIAIIIYFIVLQPSLMMIILTVFFTYAISFYTSHVGLLVNLFFPKLDYTNEAVVVKQSASVLYTMLAGFISTIVFGAIGYGMYKLVANTNAVIVIVTVLIYVVGFYVRKIVYSKGVELFNRL